MSNTTFPVVGMGATYCIGSDRYAGTIIHVHKNGRELAWQADSVQNVAPASERQWGGTQKYEYQSNPQAEIEIYTLRKNNRWVQKGRPIRGYGNLWIGERDHYMDPCF